MYVVVYVCICYRFVKYAKATMFFLCFRWEKHPQSNKGGRKNTLEKIMRANKNKISSNFLKSYFGQQNKTLDQLLKKINADDGKKKR